MRADIDSEALARTLLRKHNVKIEVSTAQTLKRHYGVRLKAKEIFIMPSFNDFLGGRPVNETRPRKEIGSEALIGPVLRSEAVDVDNSELYLLDGTYLGTLNQLRKL